MNNSDTQATQKLPDEIYRIEKKLEEARVAALYATKGLFKRTFFRSWVVLGAFLVYAFQLPLEDGFSMFNAF